MHVSVICLCHLLTFATLVKLRGHILCLVQHAARLRQHRATEKNTPRTPQGFLSEKQRMVQRLGRKAGEPSSAFL